MTLENTSKTSKTPSFLEKKRKLAEEWENETDQIAEILKNHQIDQVITHAREYKDPTEQEDVPIGTEGRRDLTFGPDLDTRLFLYLLNDTGKKSLKPVKYRWGADRAYTEGAISSIMVKGGSRDDLKEEEKRDGVILVADVGNKWLEVTKDGKTTIIYFDHHGEGKKWQTSASEMLYVAKKKAGQIGENPEEDPEWLSRLGRLVNQVDNLTYLNKKNKEGEEMWNEKYFQYIWPKTWQAVASDIPFDILVKLFKEGKVNTSRPIPKKQLEELKSIKWEITKNIKQKKETKSIATLVYEKGREAKHALNGVKKAIEYNEKVGLKTKDTKVGDLVVHDYPKIIEKKNGTKGTNTIPIQGGLGYMATRALGYDTFIQFNKSEEPVKFMLNGSAKHIPNTAERMSKKIPGIKDIRGVFIFPPKDTEALRGLTEKKFLDAIDPAIAKNAKLEEEKEVETKSKEPEPDTEEEKEGGKEKEPFEKELTEAIEKFFVNRNSIKNCEVLRISGSGTHIRASVRLKLFIAGTSETEVRIDMELENDGEDSVKVSHMDIAERRNRLEKVAIRSALPKKSTFPKTLWGQLEKNQEDGKLKELKEKRDKLKEKIELYKAEVKEIRLELEKQREEEAEKERLEHEKKEKERLEKKAKLLEEMKKLDKEKGELEQEYKKAFVELEDLEGGERAKKIRELEKDLAVNIQEVSKLLNESSKYRGRTTTKEERRDLEKLDRGISKINVKNRDITDEINKYTLEITEGVERLEGEIEKLGKEIKNKEQGVIKKHKELNPIVYKIYDKINPDLRQKIKVHFYDQIVKGEKGGFNNLEDLLENPYRRLENLEKINDSGLFLSYSWLGFFIVIKNEKEIEESGKEAVFKLIGPDGETVADDLDKEKAEKVYEEKVKEYIEKIKKEFNLEG